MDIDPKIYTDRISARWAGEEFAIAVVTATKPDFYKQAPIVAAAVDRGVPCFVVHTGQHYDEILGHGLEEYGLEEHVGADLGVRGDLTRKTAQMHRAVERLADGQQRIPVVGNSVVDAMEMKGGGRHGAECLRRVPGSRAPRPDRHSRRTATGSA